MWHTASIGKRAKALLMLAGAIPLAAHADEELPPCKITSTLSPDAKAITDLYFKRVDYAEEPRLLTDFAIKLRPKTVRVTDPDISLSDPNGPELTFTYLVRRNTSFGNWAMHKHAFTSTPFRWRAGALDGWVMTLNVNDRVGLETAEATYDMPGLRPDNGYIDTRPLALLFDGLTSDLEIHFQSLDRKRDWATFTYSRTDAAAAKDLLNEQVDALTKIYEAGECEPDVREDCFLTTATCEAVGLDDDCWELRTLRRFRDDWLANQEDGRADIATYYQRAPAIAERLRHDRRAAIKLYWNRIVPSALAASVGANRLARAIHSKGMRELAAA